jgi:hypothetical protein
MRRKAEGMGARGLGGRQRGWGLGFRRKAEGMGARV